MNSEERTLIEKSARELAQKMGFEADVEVEDDRFVQDGVNVKLTVHEGQHFLIGQKGANLAAFQHLLRAVLRKQGISALQVSIDINRYVEEKRDLLFRDVDKVVEEVLANNISVALRPMLGYERKMVHTYLADHPSVSTESVGEGELRKVMVRPKISAEGILEENNELSSL